MRGGVKGQKSRVVTQVRHDGAQRGRVTVGDRVNRFKIFRKLSLRIGCLVRIGEGREVTGSVLGLSHPISLTTHPPFRAHALVFALRNLPLNSDQESQEARLPERGAELPAAHRHPRRWDSGPKTGAWEESQARSWGVPGCWCWEGVAVSHRRQFPAQESSGCLGQRFPNSGTRELGSRKVKQSQLDLVLGRGRQACQRGL